MSLTCTRAGSTRTRALDLLSREALELPASAQIKLEQTTRATGATLASAKTNFLANVKVNIKHLVGEEVKIMVAARRCPTIRDNVVKNRQFSKEDIISKPVFKACTSKRCLTCPMYKSSGSISVNSISFKILDKFNCKTDNCIYIYYTWLFVKFAGRMVVVTMLTWVKPPNHCTVG